MTKIDFFNGNFIIGRVTYCIYYLFLTYSNLVVNLFSEFELYFEPIGLFA